MDLPLLKFSLPCPHPVCAEDRVKTVALEMLDKGQNVAGSVVWCKYGHVHVTDALRNQGLPVLVYSFRGPANELR